MKMFMNPSSIKCLRVFQDFNHRNPSNINQRVNESDYNYFMPISWINKQNNIRKLNLKS